MANAQLIVVPSVGYENCPLSILEAQAMGVPVVTMNHGGMAELVETGKNGYLVPQVTSEAFAEVLEKCMDETYYQTLKANCQAMADNVIGVSDYCQILIQKYKELQAKE